MESFLKSESKNKTFVVTPSGVKRWDKVAASNFYATSNAYSAPSFSGFLRIRGGEGATTNF
jgi:hypothetical protein